MAQMRITDGKGVQFKLDNEITISIQIGRGNYGDNYDFSLYEITRDNPLPPSMRAEIAVWDKHSSWLRFDNDDTVKGYVPVEDVLRFTEFLRSLPDDLTANEIEIACRAFDWREAAAA